MDSNQTVFESQELKSSEIAPDKKVGESTVLPKGVKKADFGNTIKDFQIKLKDPKVKLTIIAAAIVVVIITILSIILIIISLLTPKNVSKVDAPANDNVPIVQSSPDPKAEEQKKLREEVQNFDLEERPLLPPALEFDIEF